MATQSAAELISPLGRALHALQDTAGAVDRAARTLEAHPDSVPLYLDLGAAQASVWRYHNAIDTYSRGIELDPRQALLYRFRGHRYISTRQFDKAVADLERAAALDSSQFDIWYHLGLAHYLRGEFGAAASAYRACLRTVEDDDGLVAVSDWLWMALSRAGRHEEARAVLEPIHADMEINENGAYHRRLLLYKGLLTEKDVAPGSDADDLQIATLGYGIANWHLVRGDTATAHATFQRIVEGRYWPAFGFIAAEAELVRGRKREGGRGKGEG